MSVLCEVGLVPGTAEACTPGQEHTVICIIEGHHESMGKIPFLCRKNLEKE